MSKYKVTCLECGESDVHTFDDAQHVCIFSEKVVNTNIISFRWRKNNTYGFRCKCGNWNLLCKEEESDFDRFVPNDPTVFEVWKASLDIDDNKQFRMEKI